MNAKQLKDWVNGLPDDALIQILSAPHMSFPLTNPVLHAINSKTVKQVSDGIVSGKVISSFFDSHTETNPKRS
jgi:hypothetical protein